LAPYNIRSFLGLKNAEDAYKNLDSSSVLEKIKCIRDHIQNLDAHLLKTLGMVKTPLAYIVCEDEMVPPNAQDPSGNYSTVQEEMIALMPHTHLAFCDDNTKVWEIIQDLLHETKAFNRIKRSKRQQDG
jgi:hypothetical protein